MTARALRKIEDRLRELAHDPDQITPHELRVIAVQVGAQAEMIEQGLDGDE